MDLYLYRVTYFPGVRVQFHSFHLWSEARQNCICNATLPWETSLYWSPNTQIIFTLHMLVHILAVLARKFRYSVGTGWHLSFAFIGNKSSNSSNPVISDNTDIVFNLRKMRGKKKVKNKQLVSHKKSWNSTN